MELNTFQNRCYWLGFFYSQILGAFFQRQTYGIAVMDFCFYLFVKSWDFLSLIHGLQKQQTTQLHSLLDLVVTDHPESFPLRFSLSYVFWNYNRSLRLFIVTFNNNQIPQVSLSNIYPSAGWLEREAWDLFGIQFLNHSDLRRILTDYGFRGHPFRKDFPLMGYVEIRYDDSYRCLLFEPVELSQEFRLFRFEMPWSLWPAE